LRVGGSPRSVASSEHLSSWGHLPCATRHDWNASGEIDASHEGQRFPLLAEDAASNRIFHCAMIRNLLFAVSALGYAALWIWGLSSFIEGNKVAGGALIVVAGLGAALLIRLYNRDPEDPGKGVVRTIFDVLGSAWPW